MRFSAPGRNIELPARAVLVAAGTTPNITYEKEHPGSFQMDDKKKFFAAYQAVPQAEAHSRCRLRPMAKDFSRLTARTDALSPTTATIIHDMRAMS
jgi:hypothetical protein